MRRSGLAVAALVTVLAAAMLAAPAAQATPVTIDFESGANPTDHVTNQYGAPGTPAGPTWALGSQLNANFPACNTPILVDNASTAFSGSRFIAGGCPGGEPGHAAAMYFSMGYSTHSIDYEVAVSGSTVGITEIWTTGFSANGTIVAQEDTLLPVQADATYKEVPLLSGSDNIDYVAIEVGSKVGGTPDDPATGVTFAIGQHDLQVDDFTYDPPSSPPASSFVLGTNHPTTQVAAGQQVGSQINVTWFNNPNPSSSPVSLEFTGPAGMGATFNPPTVTGGSSTLTLKPDASLAPADPGQGPAKYTVTIDGYVDKGLVSEKHASVTIEVSVTIPFVVDPLSTYQVARCTPADVPVRIARDTGVNPIDVDAFIDSGSAHFQATSAGDIVSPQHVHATINQPGAEVSLTFTVAMDLAAPAGDVKMRVYVEPSGYDPVRVDGTLKLESGHIDSISPAVADTPRLGNPGTLVTVTGAGFCPGDKVGVGMAEAVAIPESVATPGKTLTFRVPRLAVSGPLTINTLAGAPFKGGDLTVHSFRNYWGFQWKNDDWSKMLTMSGDMVDEILGKDETNINVFGWLVRKPEATLYESVTNKHIPGGICFGMAFGALQMYEAPAWWQQFGLFDPNINGIRVPHSTWETGDAVGPDGNLLRWVEERFSLQFTDNLIPVTLGQVIGQAINAHDPTEDVTNIKAEMAAGHPVMIGLLRWNPGVEAHTVLGYDTEDGPDGSTIVDVVNSNVPYLRSETSDFGQHQAREFTKSQITIDANGHWSFPELGWEGGDSNLIVFPHKELPILGGKDPKLPNVFVIAGMWAFGSSGDSVTDVTGKNGGTLADHGQIVDPKKWPAGVAPLPTFGAIAGETRPLQILAADPKKAGPVTATIKRDGGGGMNINMPGLLGDLQTGAKPGQVDHVTVDDAAHSVDYSTDAASSPFGGTLVTNGGGAGARASATSSLSDRIVDFHTTSRRGGGDKVAFDSGAFDIEHSGAPAPLSLTLSGFGRDGRPVAVALPKLRLARGEKLRVAPSNWRALGGARVRVTSVVGKRRSTRIVKGRSTGRAFARLSMATFHDRGSLDLALRVKKTAAGAWISPAVDVLKGKKVVARSKPAQLTGVAMANARLALTKSVAPGRYTLRVRLLETIPKGAAQASAVVTRRLAATAR